MRISVSKKTLAIALSLAMLVTCMAFSFSANAAVVKMWENDFDNQTSTNWYSKYSKNGEQSTFNTDLVNDASYKGYAVPQKDGDNGYMAVGWQNATSVQRPIGFIALHQSTTNKTAANAGTYGHAGKYSGSTLAGGLYMPDAGNYAVKLDYKVPSTMNLSGGDIEIYISVSNKTWNGAVIWGDYAGGITRMVKEGTLVMTKLATITNDNQSAEWQTVTGLLTVPSNISGYASVIVRSTDIYAEISGREIYIDNIEIHKYDSLSDFPSVSYIYGGEEIATSSSLAGAPYTKPALTGLPENANITYWADAEFTTPATIPTVYPAESQTIYVKTEKYLANNPWGFETEAVGTSVATSSAADMRGEYLVSKEYAHSGSQSLEIECLGNQNSTKSDKTQFMLTDGNGDLIRLEVGKNYLLSYWVLVPTTAPCDFKNNMWLWADSSKTGRYSIGATMALASGNVRGIFRDNGASYQTIPKDGQWHQVIRKINGSKITATGSGYTVVGLSHLSPQEGLKVYIDDLDVICLDDLAADSTELTAYLYRGNVAAEGEEPVWTNLHSHTTNKTGIFTSMRLGAKYTASDSNGDTIMMGGVALPLSARGIVAGKADMTLNAKGTKGTDYLWSSYKTSGLDQYWDADGNKLSYTLRLANMGKEWFESANEYVWRSCFEVTLPTFYKENAVDTLISNEKAVIYGDTSDALTFGELADTFNPKDYWFSDIAS